MRIGEVFILGTITGAVAFWLWGRQIRAFATESTRELRAEVADGLRAVEETTGSVMDGSGTSLRRAAELLQSTKKRVGGALRAGQRAIRPAPATGTA